MDSLAGFYLGRKTISIAPPEMMKEFGWDFSTTTFIMSGYFWANAIGKFAKGVLGDRLGARLMLAIGLFPTIFLNAVIGFSSTIIVMFLL